MWETCLLNFEGQVHPLEQSFFQGIWTGQMLELYLYSCLDSRDRGLYPCRLVKNLT